MECLLNYSRYLANLQFLLSADPQTWGTNVSPHVPEPDDALHNPTSNGGTWISKQGFVNVGCLGILVAGLLTLFIVYLILNYMKERHNSTGMVLGANATGEASLTFCNVPEIPGNFGLIDLDMLKDAYNISSWRDGKKLQLVFSDEFEQDRRTFYPGDDPYWEAVDLHYWASNNLEWYNPAAVTTDNGSLVITLLKKPSHDLDYEGAGYGTTLDSVVFLLTSVQWPYSYDACDVGTAPNQTLDGLPKSSLTTGYVSTNYKLSYLPGQRLSQCMCDGESHPSPKHADGTYVGCSAPEIDMFEAQVSDSVGYVLQSGQWGPFDPSYIWNNNSDNLVITDPTISHLNVYCGGASQEMTSVISQMAQDCYQLGTGCFAVYGIEYISWINDGKIAWTLNAAGIGAKSETQISACPISQEPMYILANLGISRNFRAVNMDHLTFPAVMKVDYIHVYQDLDHINIGCNPNDFLTAAYIETCLKSIDSYKEAYSNPNLTTWVDDYGQAISKNSLVDQC
ncbi:glycoside hydrolase family 16 protein [Armillaria luteobubalina]|uniref:Glycoside hydrolase family 16 protein n=1 Tax=Armillaria luteobubalina TaxID=153913 RepID=A0AA39TUX3_9AGAR|nr:glycoside hydrolase family 16 protein [Armillaria luteobubalina]